MANKLHDVFVNNGGIIKMSEDGPDMVCTYNGKEIKAGDTAELLKLLSYSSGFAMPSNSVIGTSSTKPNYVEIVANETIDRDLIDVDPASADLLVKQSLAKQLADKLIEEDLIVIQANDDQVKGNTVFRAKLKCIQE